MDSNKQPSVLSNIASIYQEEKGKKVRTVRIWLKAEANTVSGIIWAPKPCQPNKAAALKHHFSSTPELNHNRELVSRMQTVLAEWNLLTAEGKFPVQEQSRHNRRMTEHRDGSVTSVQTTGLDGGTCELIAVTWYNQSEKLPPAANSVLLCVVAVSFWVSVFLYNLVLVSAANPPAWWKKGTVVLSQTRVVLQVFTNFARIIIFNT